MQKTWSLIQKMLLYIAIGGIFILTLLGLANIVSNLSENIVRNAVITYIVTLTALGMLSQLAHIYTPFPLVNKSMIENAYRIGFFSIVVLTCMLYLLIWSSKNPGLKSIFRILLPSLILINFEIYQSLLSTQKRKSISEKSKKKK